MDYTGQLQTLSISDEDVRYLDWLADFKKLTTLSLELGDSKITDFSALQVPEQLTTLTLALRGSNITDLSTLKSLKARQITLDIRHTKINSIKGLPNLTGLIMGN